MVDFYGQEFGGGWDEVVHQRAGQQLPFVVVHYFFIESGSYALGHATADLAVNDQRVNDPSAILNHNIALDCDGVGLGIDLHDRNMSGARSRPKERIVEARDLQPRFHVFGQPPQAGIGRLRDITKRQPSLRLVTQENLVVSNIQIGRIALHHVAGNLQRLFLERLARPDGRTTG